MNGDELRAARMGLNLYQATMAQQLQALGLELPGGLKIDQPALSQMERGRIPIPPEVAAAVSEGRVQPGHDAPPPVGGAGRSSAGGGQQRQQRKPRSRVRRKDSERAGEQQPDGAGGGAPAPSPQGASPPPPAPEPEPRPEPAADRPPAPPHGGGAVVVPPESWDVAAKSQLESDLRDLFAGQTFLVPVRVLVGTDDQGVDQYEIRHQQAFIPGMAQLVGAVNTYDGEIIAAHAASMAHAWAELANENPTVRRFLMGMTYGGAWRGVVAATLPVVLAIAQNHGMGLPGFLGGAPAALGGDGAGGGV